ncbi:Hypothetical_protein [Hexamita inflata]|uniref:Hypothetical_protein n=1 Tax=Hexamita inflata TaxID=28002 RepID=A0AA86N9X8_9EUKA|nr:Hypothetical protein HINF_LOCUS3026 [Hexamita inflata]
MIDANKVREVKEVSQNNNNRTDQKHKADISFIKDGKQQFFDIGISWDTERYFAVKQKHYQTETVNGQPITCTPIIIGKDTTVHPESLAALRQVGIEDSWLYQQVGILMSNYREQTDYVFRKKTRKAQDQPTELNIQEIDQTEEFSSIPVNETTNSNAGTQNSSIRPKKKPRQKSQVQHSQEIQAQMNTQTQPPQVTHNTDNTQTNQGAINIQKQVVVNNFNCSNTSLSGQKNKVPTKAKSQENLRINKTPNKLHRSKFLKPKPQFKNQRKPHKRLYPKKPRKLSRKFHLQNQSTLAKRRVNRVQYPAEPKPASATQLLKSKHKQASQDAIGKMLIRKNIRSRYAAIWQKLLTFTLKTNQSRRLVLLQKIKALQQVQNIEDVLKQASLPAQQENKQSQSEKKKVKKLQNQMDISIDDWYEADSPTLSMLPAKTCA